MKIKILLIFSFCLFILPNKVIASSYFFPLGNTLQREQYKKFGQYIDSNFYENSGNLYPAKYTGYHAGTDLEIFPNEEKQLVPVYAVSDGKILYDGEVSGYGGLILLKLSSNLTVLYGHLKLNKNNLQIGDHIKAGQKIAYLGDAFSSQTGEERKHLHFAIYKGVGQYFKGYEDTQNGINNNWLDSLKYLNSQKATDPLPQISPTIIINKKVNPSVQTSKEIFFITIINRLINYLKSL
jgi:murein DD-endopeptidase MepM/ murein hydrolase activator NlpD